MVKKKETKKVKKPVAKAHKKIAKKQSIDSGQVTSGMSEEELDGEIDGIERTTGSLSGSSGGDYTIKASKSITQVKKGDKMIIDGQTLEVDAHYVLIDHGSTKEMALELFDPKTDREFQLRYFDDQIESTLELYELQEIMYVKRPFMKISW